MANPPSILSIAAAAGVSAMTVSYSLRGNPCISAATRARVCALAEEMGYRRDPAIEQAMRALRARKRGGGAFQGTLAYLNLYGKREGLDTPYVTELLAGARERAERLGYRLEEAWAGDSLTSPARMREILRARGVVGLLVPPAPVGVRWDWDWKGFAGVAMTSTVPELAITRVVPHHYANMIALVRRLRAAGYWRMLLVTNAVQEERAGHQSLAAFEWFHRHVIGEEPQVLVRAVTVTETKIEAFDLPEGIDVVLTSATWLVAGVRGARRAGGMPRGVGLAVYGAMRPKISGIDPRVREIGKVAVEVLVAQLNRHEYGLPEYPVMTMIEGRWVQGATTRSPRKTAANG